MPDGPMNSGATPMVCMSLESRVNGSSNFKLRPSIFVVAHEHHRLADHRDDRSLIFVGQSVQQSRREGEENDLLTDARVLAFTGH